MPHAALQEMEIAVKDDLRISYTAGVAPPKEITAGAKQAGAFFGPSFDGKKIIVERVPHIVELSPSFVVGRICYDQIDRRIG